MASKPVGGASAEVAVAAAPRPPAAPDTETALLDAALAEVLEHGIRRTTASDIARRARVSRQTLYRYWPDAQAVFAALVTRELLAALPAAPPDPQELGDLVDVVVDTADRIRRMPLLQRLRDTDPELLSRYVLERLGTSQRAIHADLARRIAAAGLGGCGPRRDRGDGAAHRAVRGAVRAARGGVAPRRSLARRAAARAGRLPRRRPVTVRILGRTPASSALNADRRARELAALADHPVSTSS